MKDIEENVEKLVQQEEAAPAPQAEGSLYAELMELNRNGGEAQAKPEDDEDEVEEPTRRIDFDHLQFGKDYEIR